MSRPEEPDLLKEFLKTADLAEVRGNIKALARDITHIHTRLALQPYQIRIWP